MKELIALQKRFAAIKDERFLMKLIFSDPSFSQLIISLNLYAQLYDEGIDSDGRSLGNYSIVSVEKYGKPEGHIRLYDKGDFYRSVKVRLIGSDLVIFAGNLENIGAEKDGGDNLIKIYGKDILGLTDENLQIVIDKAREILIPKLRDYLLAA